MPMKNQNMRKHANPEEVGRPCHEIARLGFSAVHWRLFFGNIPSFENGIIQSTVSDRFDNMEAEILFIDGKRITPLETYFEWGVTDIVMPDQKVYIFQSPIDGLAFFQMKKIAESSDVVIAVGKYPSGKVLSFIKCSFPTARFVICFPRNFLGNIADIRIASMLAGQNISMEIDSDRLVCSYKDRQTSVPLDMISLSKVSEFTGFYPKRIRTLKPKLGKESFFELLRIK